MCIFPKPLPAGIILFLATLAQPRTACAQLPANADAGWIPQEVVTGISTFTRTSASGRLKEYKVQTHVDTTVEAVYFWLRQPDSVHSIDLRIRNFTHIRQPTDTEGLVYYQFKTPAFSRDRDVVLRMTYAKSGKGYIAEWRADPDAYPYNSAYIRLTDLRAFWAVQANPAGGCDLAFWGHADPGGDIPAALVNATMMESPTKMVQYVKRKAEQK